MENENVRTSKLIAEQAKLARTGQAHIDDWGLEEIAADIQILSNDISKELDKVLKGGYGFKASSKRVRKYLLAMETLGGKFRTLSV